MWSAADASRSLAWVETMGCPTSTNACASKLEQMNPVAPGAIVLGAVGKREVIGSRNSRVVRAHAWARSYPSPIRLTTQSARRRRSVSCKSLGRSTRTRSPLISVSGTALTPSNVRFDDARGFALCQRADVHRDVDHRDLVCASSAGQRVCFRDSTSPYEAL